MSRGSSGTPRGSAHALRPAGAGILRDERGGVSSGHLEQAKEQKMESVCFLGRDGGFTCGAATLDIMAPGQSTVRIQESQKLLFHVLCQMVETKLPK